MVHLLYSIDSTAERIINLKNVKWLIPRIPNLELNAYNNKHLRYAARGTFHVCTFFEGPDELQSFALSD
jgi:hypothetical protein